MDDKRKSDMWYALSDNFMGRFDKHQSAINYSVRHNVANILERDEISVIAYIQDNPWIFTAEQHKIFNEYGITDDEIRSAWKLSCEWANVNDSDFPCPLS